MDNVHVFTRRRRGRRWKRRDLHDGGRNHIRFLLLTVAFSSHVLLDSAHGSSFPGTIKSTTPSASTSDSWWNPNPPNSDDELSSSDYEWADEGVEQSVTEDEGDEVQEMLQQSGDVPGLEDNEGPSTSAGASDKIREPKATADTNNTRISNPVGESSQGNELQRPQATAQSTTNSPAPGTRLPATVSPPTSEEYPDSKKSAAINSSNKPLKTIEKLQQMLDETDYMTSRRANRSMENPITQLPHPDQSGSKQQEYRTPDHFNPNPPERENAPFEVPEETTGRSEATNEVRQDLNTAQLPEEGALTLEGDVKAGRQPSRRLDQQQDKLWTSKDRSKYKRQQQLLRRKKEEQDSYYRDPHRLREYQQKKVYEQQQQQRMLQKRQASSPPPMPREPQQLQQQQQHPLQQVHISDAEDHSDTDDGLGYTLPNLPVYYSDAENDSDDADAESVLEDQRENDRAQNLYLDDTTSSGQPDSQQQYQQQQPPGWYPQQPQQPLNNGQHPQMQGTYPNYVAPYGYQPPPPPNGAPPLTHIPGYPYPPPYQYSNPHYQQQLYAAYYNAWRNAAIHGSYNPYSDQRQRQTTPSSVSASAVPRIGSTVPPNPKVPNASTKPIGSKTPPPQEIPQQAMTIPQSPFPFYGSMPPDLMEQLQPNEELTSRLTFVSVQKLATCLVLGALLCYSAVSPRTLPLVEYNQHFYTNLRIAYLAIIPPALVLLFVLNPAQNDVNQLVNCFYNSFTVGYVLAFVMEIVAATVVRLLVFCIWEPDVFQLAPTPFFIIPWTLREHKYKPKRISLFAADLVSSCVACPLVEEYLKLALLQFTVRLPRNFRWVTKTSNKSKKKRKVAETVAGTSLAPDSEVTNVNSYISNMLAVSVGLKLADSVRRICMYTKSGDQNKSFYAFFRGIFPIHELCGTVTALALARRDVLGQPMPLWKLLLPSVVIHAMANFRGMKPIFKWNSATPWSEMQLSPHIPVEDATLGQLAGKAFPKIMWLIILFRVLGYCVKNYYLINRHAVKRTTTFAGKHAAFSAALEATETLKRSKKKN